MTVQASTTACKAGQLHYLAA